MPGTPITGSARWAGTRSSPLFARRRQKSGSISALSGNQRLLLSSCETARATPGSDPEQKALAVQRAEWQLLFDYCARAV